MFFALTAVVKVNYLTVDYPRGGGEGELPTVDYPHATSLSPGGRLLAKTLAGSFLLRRELHPGVALKYP